MKRFNIRVYGICINEDQEILLSDESFRGHDFTKFPGGGLEWGEGTRECLIREFQEEFELDIEVGELFYLTDFFQASAFSEVDQVISVYYHIQLPENATHHDRKGDKGELIHWVKLHEFHEDVLTFPIDRHVAKLIREKYHLI
jgi:8-oxo-dGTP diphosphatase